RNRDQRAAAGIELEIRVDRAVEVEAGEPIPDDAAGGADRLGAGEMSADHELPVGLEGERVDLAVERGREVVVERRIRLEARDVIARHGFSPAPPDRGESPAN